MASQAEGSSLPSISTSHSYFLTPTTPPTAHLLRGVNLSSTAKFPTFPPEQSKPAEGRSRGERDREREFATGVASHIGEEEGQLWSEAEAGGRDGWFVGRPLLEAEAEVHLRRLKACGYTTIRYLVTWEALEHTGPGKYDEEYIDYTIRILQLCKKHGFRVFISTHQDVFSRFLSGSGAPYWVLEAVGLNPRRIHQTGAAVCHWQWEREGYGGEEGRKAAATGTAGEWPDMIWNTNLHRLAARHCFTMFFASSEFAPQCRIDGRPVDEWLQRHFNSAYGHLADRLREVGGLLDECVIGWDSMNEPNRGFVGLPDLAQIPDFQDFRKGPSPTPIQSLQLGNGRPVQGIQYDDFGSLGRKSQGKVNMTPPGGEAVWLTRDEAKRAQQRWGYRWDEGWDFWDAEGRGGCPWAGHGLWDPKTGDILKADHFAKPAYAKEYDFIADFWRPHYEAMLSRIRDAHPDAISFVNPPVFESPPDLSEDVKRGRVALSSHYYDGLTLLGKRRHLFNADAVGLQRGLINMLQAVKVGTGAIKESLRNQLGELKSDASEGKGIAADEPGKKEYPMIIGETGVPFDMKKTKFLGLAKGDSDGQYAESAKAMDQTINACDGSNALSYTLWCYEPLNTHARGDGWNGEDLSLFSYDDCRDSPDDDLRALDPPDLGTLITLGTRGVEAWCRPYPVSTQGRIKYFSFDMSSGTFELRLEVLSCQSCRTWMAESGHGDADSLKAGMKATCKVYLPFVHYRKKSDKAAAAAAKSAGKPDERRLRGRPGAHGEEWTKGEGPAVVDVEVLELSEGKLDVEGQYASWIYTLREEGDRELNLKIRRWTP